jgi:hypothetical protein
MSNIPEVYLLQATKRNLELAKAFQDDMGAHFFEHTMYDVKDALTSILALCDMEDMKQVPQVKKYIQRVTDLLHDVRLYQSSSLFNVNHVVINVINAMKHKYKSKIVIHDDLTFIKANVKSDKSHLEQVLLYSLIEAVESSTSGIELKIELIQREHDAVITLRLENFEYSPVVLKEIRTFHNASAFRMQINEVNGSTEVVIRLPLSFETREKESESHKASLTLTLGELKLAEMQSRPSDKKAKEMAYVHGAQERT